MSRLIASGISVAGSTSKFARKLFVIVLGVSGSFVKRIPKSLSQVVAILDSLTKERPQTLTAMVGVQQPFVTKMVGKHFHLAVRLLTKLGTQFTYFGVKPRALSGFAVNAPIVRNRFSAKVFPPFE